MSSSSGTRRVNRWDPAGSRECVLKDAKSKRLQMFLGVIRTREKRQDVKRGRKKWKHDPSSSLWTPLHLSIIPTPGSKTQTGPTSCAGLAWAHKHAGVCIQTLKLLRQQLPATFQWCSHTMETCYTTRCVCVFICIHPCVSSIKVCSHVVCAKDTWYRLLISPTVLCSK